MISKLAVYFTNKIIDVSKCEKKEYDVYIYGFELLSGQIITYTLLLISGIVMQSLPQMITYVVFLVALQGQTGGYHAETHAGCISFSCIVSIGAVIIAKSISQENFILALPVLVASIIYILCKTPINHIKLDLSPYEMGRLRKLTRYVLLLEGMVICFFFIAKLTQLVMPACLAIITVAITMKLAKILNQEVI